MIWLLFYFSPFNCVVFILFSVRKCCSQGLRSRPVGGSAQTLAVSVSFLSLVFSSYPSMHAVSTTSSVPQSSPLTISNPTKSGSNTSLIPFTGITVHGLEASKSPVSVLEINNFHPTPDLTNQPEILTKDPLVRSEKAGIRLLETNFSTCHTFIPGTRGREFALGWLYSFITTRVKFQPFCRIDIFKLERTA